MIDYEKLSDLFAAQQSIHENLKPVIESLKDKNISLNERWDVYKDLVKRNLITEIEGYGDGYVDFLKRTDKPDREICLYDDFYVDRHVTRTFVEMYEVIMDRWPHDAPPKYTKESTDAWREKVLSSPETAAFTYDW